MDGRRVVLRCALVLGLTLLLALGSLGLLAVPARAAAYSPVWTNETALGGPRAQATVVQAVNGTVYVIGGYNTTSYTPLNLTNSYNPATGQWMSLAPLPTRVRGAAGAVGADGLIYVFSGDGGSGNVASTQIYNPISNTWSAGTDVPTPVWQGRAALGVDGMIYVFGGYSSSLSTTVGAVQIYDPTTDSWSSGTVMPTTLNSGATVVLGSYIYYIGGSHNAWYDATSSVYRYYVYGSSWDTVQSLPVVLSGLAAVKGVDGLIYAFGGGPTGSNFGIGSASGYYYDPSIDTWSAIPDLLVPIRQLAGAATSDGRILAIGGDNATQVFSTVESLQIVKVTITPASASVGQGTNLLVNVDVEFANRAPTSYSTAAYLLGADGTAYQYMTVSAATPGPFAFQMAIPQSMPAASYTLVLHNLVAYPFVVLPDQTVSVTVISAESLAEQIAALQAQLVSQTGNMTALKDQITALQTQLNDLQTQLNGMGTNQTTQGDRLNTIGDQTDKAKTTANTASMLGIVSIVLLIVVLALLAMMFMASRKKP